MPRPLTEEAKLELQEAFKTFDLDGNGFIDNQEITAMFETLKIPFTETTINNIFTKIDTDGNGYLDFDEFCTFMQSLQPTDKETELKAIFDQVDVDGSGEIDSEELQNLLIRLGHLNMSEEELFDYLDLVDQNGDHKISFEEFKTFFGDLL